MTIRKKDLHTGLSAQQRLFDPGLSEGDLDVSMAFRDSLTKALRKTDISRHFIAAKVSELTGHTISKDMLDKYTSSNTDYGLRAEDLPAFCIATGSADPFRALLIPISYDIVSPEEGDYLKIARLEKQRAELESEISRLKTKAGIKSTR